MSLSSWDLKNYFRVRLTTWKLFIFSPIYFSRLLEAALCSEAYQAWHVLSGEQFFLEVVLALVCLVFLGVIHSWWPAFCSFCSGRECINKNYLIIRKSKSLFDHIPRSYDIQAFEILLHVVEEVWDLNLFLVDHVLLAQAQAVFHRDLSAVKVDQVQPPSIP